MLLAATIILPPLHGVAETGTKFTNESTSGVILLAFVAGIFTWALIEWLTRP